MSLDGKNVWIVMKGEDYEGGEVAAIFDEFGKAEKWTLDNIINHPERRKDWDKITYDKWHRGCENITIERWKINRPDGCSNACNKLWKPESNDIDWH